MLMRGTDYHKHPKRLMGKKSSPCGRTDGAVVVMDHGNGFMFHGTSDIDQARRLLVEYVEDPEAYGFAARAGIEDGACRVWLSDDPGATWNLT